MFIIKAKFSWLQKTNLFQQTIEWMFSHSWWSLSSCTDIDHFQTLQEWLDKFLLLRHACTWCFSLVPRYEMSKFHMNISRIWEIHKKFPNCFCLHLTFRQFGFPFHVKWAVQLYSSTVRSPGMPGQLSPNESIYLGS